MPFLAWQLTSMSKPTIEKSCDSHCVHDPVEPLLPVPYPQTAAARMSQSSFL